jgi:hypothetical protein
MVLLHDRYNGSELARNPVMNAAPNPVHEILSRHTLLFRFTHGRSLAWDLPPIRREGRKRKKLRGNHTHLPLIKRL